MLDGALYSEYPFSGAFDVDHRNYDPKKSRIKDILWNNFNWIFNLYAEDKIRSSVLENVEKALLCNTAFLGYDFFECPQCGNWNILFHKCHSRFCNSCGTKNFDFDQMRNFGAIAAIHTFDHDLKWNPHIHMLVAEMYYDPKKDKVVWYFDDHNTDQRYYVHGIGKNLLLRMFMHILDDHFKTIRYYGFYNQKERKTLEHIYKLLEQKKKYARSLKEMKKQLRIGLKKTHFRTMCLDSFNRDILRCKCGAIMQYVSQRFLSFHHYIYDPFIMP